MRKFRRVQRALIRRLSAVEGLLTRTSARTNALWRSFVVDQVLRYERDVVAGLASRRLPAAHFFDYEVILGEAGARRVAGHLAEHGVVVLQNAVALEEIDRAAALLEEFLQRRSRVLSGESDPAYLQVATEGATSGLKGYEGKAKYHKTVVNERGGQDDGMIDIFNVDIAVPQLGQFLDRVLGAKELLDVVQQSVSMEIVTEGLHVYVNQSVTNTRRYHVDAYRARVKIFLYLTDVESAEDGPYCYALGSHKNLLLGRTNRTLAAWMGLRDTDCPVVFRHASYMVPGPKGTIIISYQNGAHRGYPQSETGHRRLAVQSILVPNARSTIEGRL